MAKWTDDQLKAIYAPSGEGNILVSAAAGSGKTAVLVERIAQMILRRDNPVSVDNLLVVTFTEAAAAEMKERIIARINEAQRAAFDAGDASEAKRLREQIHLTTTADINTIDAFCLRAVKNNFHILGIDPNFGIMDNGETDILAEDAMDDLFASLYASEDESIRKRFENLVRVYASNRDDEGLGRIVRKLYDFSQSFPDPMEWIRGAAAMYDENMADSEWIKRYVLEECRNYVTEQIGDTFELLRDEMRDVTPQDVDIAKYWGSLWEKVNNCAAAARRLAEAKEWDDYASFCRDCIDDATYLGNGRNKHTKSTLADKDTWQEYFNRLDEPRVFFRSECKVIPSVDKDEFNKSIHAAEIKRTVDDLVWLTELYNACCEERKAARNIKSFADVEHLAYRLFAENESIRGEYADRYSEILIDEFQDTNGLQDSIFRLISTGNKNIFMVGDLKQSIYRFRGGDPMIFKKRSRLYSKSDGGTLISLSQNFRSRMQVIDSINAVFSAMMSDYVGDVDYTGAEMLSRDSDKELYPEGGGSKAELYRIAAIKEGDSDISRARAEAAVAAERIKELVKEKYQIFDDGKQRDIEYRDIVILMKSVKTDGPVFREELEKRGIGAFVQKEEYFERREIKLMLSLISVINNHMQDIPLLAVMRSPIGGFTENELAKIRIASDARPFYKAVEMYAAPENPTDEETRLEKRCRRFTSDLERWRGYVKRKSIAALIWTLFEETGIYDLMGAMDGGEEAQANLRLLYERAKRYESSGFRGIFDFIRYIGRMERRREDIAGAQLVNSAHNVVRIMTIHKSKGLEFPVVVLAGTGKTIKYSLPGDETRIALHNEMGIGLDYYNYEDMYVKPLIFRERIVNANRREQLSEEMRLLYVAATRAREKLIVTAAYNFSTQAKYEDALDAWGNLESATWDTASTAKSLADWLIPVAQSDSVNWICRDVCGFTDVVEDTDTQESLTDEEDNTLRDTVKTILEYSYRYPESGAIPAKTSVTAIKEMADEEHIRGEDPVYMASMPAFMRGDNLGARIGTAHHQVMAYINLEKMKALDESKYEVFVADEIKRITDEGQIETEIAEDSEITGNICKNVCAFFRGDMGKKVLGAKNVYREQPFEIEISAREYDAGLGGEYENEGVVVQGIIDLFFEDNDGNITLVDYKTDRCRTDDEQRAVGERYRRQVELYERAMETILKIKVKNKFLYLFSAHNVVEL